MSEYVMAWVIPLIAQTLSPWANVSDALYSDAIELALDRLEKQGEYREPLASEIDSAIEDLMTDPDYRRHA